MLSFIGAIGLLQMMSGLIEWQAQLLQILDAYHALSQFLWKLLLGWFWSFIGYELTPWARNYLTIGVIASSALYRSLRVLTLTDKKFSVGKHHIYEPNRWAAADQRLPEFAQETKNGVCTKIKKALRFVEGRMSIFFGYSWSFNVMLSRMYSNRAIYLTWFLYWIVAWPIAVFTFLVFVFTSMNASKITLSSDSSRFDISFSDEDYDNTLSLYRATYIVFKQTLIWCGVVLVLNYSLIFSGS